MLQDLKDSPLMMGLERVFVRVRVKPYISELAQSKLTKGSDDLPTDFVGDIQLHHTHIRRAEGRVLFGSHDDDFKHRRLVAGCLEACGLS